MDPDSLKHLKQDQPIGTFDLSRPLILEPWPNGGWSLTQRAREAGLEAERVGAFTSSQDMIDALASALTHGAKQ